MEKILKNYWTLLIGAYFEEEYSIEADHALDLDLHPLDKNTCISINKEISTITIYDRKPNGEINGREVASDETEIYSLLTDSKSW